jgi:hypothetical protein
MEGVLWQQEDVSRALAVGPELVSALVVPRLGAGRLGLPSRPLPLRPGAREVQRRAWPRRPGAGHLPALVLRG